MLLHRYGVVFRDLAANETSLPRWRELHGLFRRLEDRGLVRGGRFVSGFSGEQFALPQAVESLRACRNRPLATMPPLTIAAADPVNLIGIVLPGERTTAIPGRTVTFPPPNLPADQNPPQSPLPATLLPLQQSTQESDIHA
jgi:ATP-dependent Lhr-like helicase